MRPTPANIDTISNAVVWTLTSISLVCVALRLYSRLILRNNAGAEDAIIGFCALFNLASAAMNTVAIAAGTGTHISRIPDSELPDAMYLNLIATALALLDFVLPKLSVAILIVRILETGRKTTIVLISAAWVVILLGIINVVLGFALCQPMTSQWLDLSRESAKCLSPSILQKTSITTSALSTALDIILALYPAMRLSQLSMSRARRIGISILLGLGLLAAAIGIYKIVLWSDEGQDSVVSHPGRQFILTVPVPAHARIHDDAMPSTKPATSSLLLSDDSPISRRDVLRAPIVEGTDETRRRETDIIFHGAEIIMWCLIEANVVILAACAPVLLSFRGKLSRLLAWQPFGPRNSPDDGNGNGNRGATPYERSHRHAVDTGWGSVYVVTRGENNAAAGPIGDDKKKTGTVVSGKEVGILDREDEYDSSVQHHHSAQDQGRCRFSTSKDQYPRFTSQDAMAGNASECEATRSQVYAPPAYEPLAPKLTPYPLTGIAQCIPPALPVPAQAPTQKMSSYSLPSILQIKIPPMLRGKWNTPSRAKTTSLPSTATRNDSVPTEERADVGGRSIALTKTNSISRAQYKNMSRKALDEDIVLVSKSVEVHETWADPAGDEPRRTFVDVRWASAPGEVASSSAGAGAG